jgi:hypothetical protein
MNCRYCNFDLDGGDIYEVLKVHPLYMDRLDREIRKIAENYGWTDENKLHFNKSIIIQFNEHHKEQVEICPMCKGISPLDKSAAKEYYEEEKSS